MIHDPYYCQQRAPRVRPRTSINSPALPSIITRRCRTKHPGPGDIPPCNVTALPRPSWRGKTRRRSIITSFTFGLHLLSSASISTWLARSAILEFQIPEGPLLDSRCLQYTVSVASSVESEHQSNMQDSRDTTEEATAAVPHPVPHAYGVLAYLNEISATSSASPPMAAIRLVLANGRAVLLLDTNGDETVNSLVGQVEICNEAPPRWIPSAWNPSNTA